MRPIRVVLVDDQGLFREGLRTLLSVHDDVDVVGEARDGGEALETVRTLDPDVVLMDLRMPGMDGVEATRRLVESGARARVVALTTFDDDDSVLHVLRAGAVGYLLKDVPSAQLLEAVRAAARGESFLQPSVAAKVVAELQRTPSRAARGNEALAEPLTERELEVLCELARGASNKDIGERLHLAEGTVKNHVTQILGKLAVSDRTRAALRARELGLV